MSQYLNTPQHGGNLHQAIQRYGIPRNDWLDLSTGISPFVWPVPPVPDEIWQRLPEDDGELEQAAQDYYGATSLAVPGSQWAIQQLPKQFAPTRVWIAEQSYEEYRFHWQRHQHRLQTFQQLPAADDIRHNDIVILINPNNPTAHYHDPDTLVQLAETLQQNNGWLIVDEAFMDVTPDASIQQMIEDHANLIVLRSMGKFFGLAGIRVGFLFGPEPLRKRLSSQLDTWAISHPARWIAVQALQDHTWQSLNRQRLQIHSAALQTILKQYFTQVEFAATPLFTTLRFDNAETPSNRQHQLAQRGILVRCFPQWHCLRFGTTDETGLQRLACSLKSIA